MQNIKRECRFLISTEIYLGKINITENYIKSVVSKTVSSCFGVAAMNCSSLKEFFLSKILRRKVPGLGVSVSVVDNEAAVVLHISMAYGTNISAVVRSVKNKVYFVLSETVGISVRSVNIFVDEIKS